MEVVGCFTTVRSLIGIILRCWLYVNRLCKHLSWLNIWIFRLIIWPLEIINLYSTVIVDPLCQRWLCNDEVINIFRSNRFRILRLITLSIWIFFRYFPIFYIIRFVPLHCHHRIMINIHILRFDHLITYTLPIVWNICTLRILLEVIKSSDQGVAAVELGQMSDLSWARWVLVLIGLSYVKSVGNRHHSNFCRVLISKICLEHVQFRILERRLEFDARSNFLLKFWRLLLGKVAVLVKILSIIEFCIILVLGLIVSLPCYSPLYINKWLDWISHFGVLWILVLLILGLECDHSILVVPTLFDLLLIPQFGFSININGPIILNLFWFSLPAFIILPQLQWSLFLMHLWKAGDCWSLSSWCALVIELVHIFLASEVVVRFCDEIFGIGT